MQFKTQCIVRTMTFCVEIPSRSNRLKIRLPVIDAGTQQELHVCKDQYSCSHIQTPIFLKSFTSPQQSRDLVGLCKSSIDSRRLSLLTDFLLNPLGQRILVQLASRNLKRN
jgi:hypothetical protein